MESITQAALGAAIGEVTIGNRIGRKAMLWGAVVATLPDLDVLANPFIDEIAELGWHRNITHSLLFVAVASPIIGWVFSRIYKRRAPIRQWILFSGLTLFTAILIDCFNMYGTQILQPFSNYKVGLDSLSIIDPLFTLPLIAGILPAIILGRKHPAGRRAVIIGLVLSSAYLLLTLAIKAHVTDVVKRSLHESRIEFTDFVTSPTIGNTILWWVVARSSEGTHVGYYSLFDSRDSIDFKFVPSGEHLLEPIRDSRAVRALLWFSDGFFSVTSGDGRISFADLRFGEIRTDDSTPPQYVFTWEIVTDPESGQVGIEVRRPRVDNAGQALRSLIQRARGI